MSGFRALPPPPTVEDAMDDVALTPYHHPQSTLNFEGWSEQQGPLPQLSTSVTIQLQNITNLISTGFVRLVDIYIDRFDNFIFCLVNSHCYVVGSHVI